MQYVEIARKLLKKQLFPRRRRPERAPFRFDEQSRWGQGFLPDPAQESRHPGFPRTGLLPEVDVTRGDGDCSAAPVRRQAVGTVRLVRFCVRSAACRLPSLRPSPLPSTPSAAAASRPCSGASSVLRGSSDPSPVPRQLRLLAFLPRPGAGFVQLRAGQDPQVPTRSFQSVMGYLTTAERRPLHAGAASLFAFDVSHRLGLCDDPFAAQ